ncbi:ribonuclease P protein component [Jatrophihabitans sp. YIM 134969]
MLPAAHRMRRGEDFTATTRKGRRARAGSVVVHHLPGDDDSPALVGFVVGKAVGNSVVRHRVARRLRAQMMPMLEGFPAGSRTVVRALPPAATAASVALSNDLHDARRRLERSGR